MSSEPRRLEIIGVAGTGKSTLTRALAERYTECLVADSLHTRLSSHWPYIAHSVPRVLPLLAGTARARPALSWEEVKFLVYISEWSRYLRAHSEHRVGVTVLDQGPIFALACLLWGDKPATYSPRFQAWVRQMVEHWSTELDAIVWLDAPDHVLLERINQRDQRHEAKGKAREDALELIDSHGRAYGRLLDLISRLGRPRVLRFDTSAMSSAELVGEVGREFEEMGWLTDRPQVCNVR